MPGKVLCLSAVCHLTVRKRRKEEKDGKSASFVSCLPFDCKAEKEGGERCWVKCFVCQLFAI